MTHAGSFRSSFAAADQPNRPGVELGTGAIVRQAAHDALKVRGAATPTGYLGKSALRVRIAELHVEHKRLGGRIALRRLDGLSRIELLAFAGKLAAANRELAKKGQAA